MEENPDRNWRIIYQQGWLLFLKEKLDKDQFSSFSRRKQHQVKRANGDKDQICWKYNQGVSLETTVISNTDVQVATKMTTPTTAVHQGRRKMQRLRAIQYSRYGNQWSHQIKLI